MNEATEDPIAGSSTYCGRCGGVVDDTNNTGGSHHDCKNYLKMEPPRYCRACRRRMTVQVDPFGWSAECSQHGRVTS